MKQLVLIAAAFLWLTNLTGQQSHYRIGDGLTIGRSESTFKVKFGARVQTLYTYEASARQPKPLNTDLVVRRFRLKADGHLFNPRLEFKVELGLSARDRSAPTDVTSSFKLPDYVLDAVLQYELQDNLSLWFGQTKLPGNRERVVSSQALQMVDRSPVNSLFNLDREMGIQLRSQVDLEGMIFRPMASISLGEGRNAILHNLGGFHYIGRLEWLPFGEFKSKGDYFESDLSREPESRIAFGLTYSYNDNAVRQSATGKFLVQPDGQYLKSDIETVLLDAVLKHQGWSISATLAHRMIANGPMASSDFQDRAELIDHQNNTFFAGSGIHIQSAYLFKFNVEPGLRFSRVVPDAINCFKGLSEYTFGLSHYLNGHKLKWQSDLSYVAFDGQPNGRWRYRLQFEIGF